MSDDQDLEIQSRVPRAHAGTLTDVLLALDKLTKAIIGDPYDPKAPPGVMMRQNAQEALASDHERRILVIELDEPTKIRLREQFAQLTVQVQSLLTREETQRNRVEDRTATRIAQVAGLVAAAILGIVGTILVKGIHP